MQLKYKLSIITASLLITSSINAEDFVRVNYMQYDENDNRVSIQAPAIEMGLDFGTDYTLTSSIVADVVSGATPIYSDTTSGASAYKRGIVVDISKIKKENVDFTESRSLVAFGLVSRLDNRDEITTSISRSYESDYESISLSADYLMWAEKNKNRSYNAGLSYQSNRILIKDCSYNEYCSDSDTTSGASSKETASVISTEIGMTQIIDKKSLTKASIFYSNESGYLSNPYYNVVRNTNEVVAEQRPDKRVAYGFNLKYFREFNDKLSSKFKYKFYTDDWGINSHTIDINNYYNISSKYILGFGIRYYTQSEADFYSDDITYFTNEKFASHDDRLSAFNSTTLKSSLTYKYSDSLSYDLSASLYDQSTGLNAVYTTVGIKYKF